MFSSNLTKIATEKTLLVLLLAISLCVNLLFAIELKKSRDFSELLRANRQLTIGEDAPFLKALDERGQEISVDFSGHQFPTLLYLQSASCHWCEQNKANLRELMLQAPGRYEIINLSFEKATNAEMRLDSNSNVRYLFEPSIESRMSFNLTSTPTTMLFSSEGRLQKIWNGAYLGERKTEVEKMLGVHLPGVSESDLNVGFAQD